MGHLELGEGLWSTPIDLGKPALRMAAVKPPEPAKISTQTMSAKGLPVSRALTLSRYSLRSGKACGRRHGGGSHVLERSGS